MATFMFPHKQIDYKITQVPCKYLMHVHANNQCMLYFNTFLCHLCCLFSVVFFSFHTHITLTLHCSNLRIILGLHTFELRNKDSFFQYFEMIKYG